MRLLSEMIPFLGMGAMMLSASSSFLATAQTFSPLAASYNAIPSYYPWGTTGNFSDSVTGLYLRQSTFTTRPSTVTDPSSLADFTYYNYNIEGVGPFFQIQDGVGSVWIDLRGTTADINARLTSSFATYEPSAYSAITGQPSPRLNVTFSVYNQIENSAETLHVHGLQVDSRFDGAPYLSTTPIPFNHVMNVTYSIRLDVNSGTYFMHGHKGVDLQKGLSAPFVILYDVPNDYGIDYTLPAVYGKTNLRLLMNSQDKKVIQDVIFFMEDWCLLYVDDDDRGAATHSTQVSSTYACMNPELAIDNLWNEWIGPGGKKSLFDDPKLNLINTCLPGDMGNEFAYGFQFVNKRPITNPQIVLAPIGTTIRLRIINSAGMSNYKLDFGSVLNQTAVFTSVDGRLIHPVHLETVWTGPGQRFDVLLKLPANDTAGNTYPIYAYGEGDPADDNGFSVVSGLVIQVYDPTDNTTYATSAAVFPMTLPRVVSAAGLLSNQPDVLMAQEKSFRAYKPLPTKHVTREYSMNITGYNGIRGLNGYDSWVMPPLVPNFVPNPHPYVVTLNDRVCINITNFNWEPHPIHLHGHRFQVYYLGANDSTTYGGIYDTGAVRDTVMVPAGSCYRVRICFDADNEWQGAHMLHCQMIVHQTLGLMTTVEYDTFKYTPIDISSAITSDIFTITLTKEEKTQAIAVGISLGVVFLITIIALCITCYKLARHKAGDTYGKDLQDVNPGAVHQQGRLHDVEISNIQRNSVSTANRTYKENGNGNTINGNTFSNGTGTGDVVEVHFHSHTSAELSKSLDE